MLSLCYSVNLMKLKLNLKKVFKTIFVPLIISTTLVNLNFSNKKVLAESKANAANLEDLALYEGMGISYVCNATRKEIALEFDKALSVASSTFVTVVRSKHGGIINDKGKEFEINPESLYNNISFRVLGGALNVCPENVPKKSKKLFEKELARIKKLNKK